MSKFKFKDLTIWQRAMNLGEELNNLADSFPKKELFNLSSQICRAGDSVALNISEGSIGQSNAEFGRFLSYAIRSIAEVVTCLHKAQKRNYLADQKFRELYEDCFNLMNMTIAFKKKLNNRMELRSSNFKLHSDKK